ncbi:MAG: MFS transporter, partial [Bryobacteraceae bacterium]
LAGLVADRVSRKSLILGGLVFWSLVTVATGLSRGYWDLVFFRALEGFGEAFYFPASMSLISDYHEAGTRSRAMSLHQSSVYAGTIAGGAMAGYLGQHFGWRSGFYFFGTLGLLLAIVLFGLLREPERDSRRAEVRERGAFLTGLRQVFAHPMARILTLVFVGANFVAMVFLTWLPSFLFDKFGMSLSLAGFTSTAYLQVASVVGVLTGGTLADYMVRRHPGGRMITQSLGLYLGVPFLVLTGWTLSPVMLVLSMTMFGFAKGLYDANIWASVFDVVPVQYRATAVGFINSIGWLGGGLAPVLIASLSSSLGMSASISATGAIYLMLALLMSFGVSRYMRVR